MFSTSENATANDITLYIDSNPSNNTNLLKLGLASGTTITTNHNFIAGSWRHIAFVSNITHVSIYYVIQLKCHWLTFRMECQILLQGLLFLFQTVFELEDNVMVRWEVLATLIHSESTLLFIQLYAFLFNTMLIRFIVASCKRYGTNDHFLFKCNGVVWWLYGR